MRSMIRYNGELLDQCDVASMYPVILLQKYMNDFCDDDNEKQLINEVIHAENPRNIFMKWCDELNEEKDIQVAEGAYFLTEKAWDKVYQKWMDIFRSWIAENKDNILYNLNTLIFLLIYKLII